MKRVLIVEDQKMVRDNMADYINASDEFTLAGTLSNAATAEIFCEKNHVDLILMDVCTENDESGLDAASSIKKHYPDIKIIIVTSMAECSFIERARQAKADSFWYKDIESEELIDIMKRTAAGESIYPDRTPEVKVGLASSYEFTNSELKVLRLLVEGLSYEEIAAQLGYKPTTVITHTNNMLSKTGYKNKLRLCIAVSNKKLIIPTPDKDL